MRWSTVLLMTGAILLWAILLGVVCGADSKPVPQIAYYQPIQVTVIPAADGRLVLVAPGGELWELRAMQGPGPNPQPQPNPNPQPQPQPNPSPNKAAYLYVVAESKDLTPATAKVKDAKAWRDACDKAGVRWAVFDPDAVSSALPNVVAQAKKCGLPAVVVLDQQGLPRTEKLPATPEAMVELVGRVAK